MVSYQLNPNSLEEPTFSSTSHHPYFGTHVLTGSCSRDEHGLISVEFQVQYDHSEEKLLFSGRLEQDGSLQGTRSVSYLSAAVGQVPVTLPVSFFILRRISPDVMRFRPSPLDLAVDVAKGRAQTLWRFAIQCTLHKLRKERWSWSYFQERRDVRKRYIRLNMLTSPMNDTETDIVSKGLRECRTNLTRSEIVFYDSIVAHLLATRTRHL